MKFLWSLYKWFRAKLAFATRVAPSVKKSLLPSYGGIELGAHDLTFSSGAGFALNKPSACDFEVFEGDLQAVLIKGSPVIIVRNRANFQDIEQLLDVAHTMAQRTLDILGMIKKYFYATLNAHHDHLLWWRESAGVVVRLQSSEAMNIRSEVSWIKRTADGKIERSNDVPMPPWHEAFRYFRYSQLRDDLYAAYREAFLAVEALLSSYAPRQAYERERDWHIRANRQLEAAGLLFTSLVANPGGDAVVAFVNEQYKAQRCAHFHAKAGDQHFIPGALADRHLVSDALERLGRYITEAARIMCNANSSVGVITFAGIQNIISTFAKDLTLAVSQDMTPATTEDISVSPAGQPITKLTTIYEGVSDGAGYEHAFLGTTSVADMKSMEVNTIASLVPSALITRGNVHNLFLYGANRFEYRGIVMFTSRAGLRADFTL